MRVAAEERTLRPRTKAWLLSIWIELEDLSYDFSLKPFIVCRAPTPTPQSHPTTDRAFRPMDTVGGACDQR